MELALNWVVCNYDGIIKVLTLLLASSGWIKVWYDHLGNKPKLSGSILCVIEGEYNFGGVDYISFMMYPYILNLRKNSVLVLDYELYVKTSVFSRWERALRSYGVEKIPNLSFSTKNDGENISFNNLAENMIYNKGLPVEQGKPVHGWLHFLIDIKYREKKIYKYKLVCVDAYGKKHSIITPADKGFNPYLLMEVAKMTLPASMLQKTPV